MRKWLRNVKPTPKVTIAVVAGLFALVVIAVAEWVGLADVQDQATGLLVLALSAIGGWLKSDASSPGEVLDAETDGFPGEHA